MRRKLLVSVIEWHVFKSQCKPRFIGAFKIY